MALVEICGLNSYLDFDLSRNNVNSQREIESYSKNFINNLDLAVPPFANVRIERNLS